MAEAHDTDFADDMKPVSATDLLERTTLIAHLEQFFHRKQIEADWDAISKANNETLVTALSMVCPFSLLEKQALLEAGGFLERANILTILLEIGSREDDDSPSVSDASNEDGGDPGTGMAGSKAATGSMRAIARLGSRHRTPGSPRRGAR